MLQVEFTTGPEALSQWKIPTSSGIEAGSFRFVAQCVHQLRHPVPPLSKDHKLHNTMAEKTEERIQWCESLNTSWTGRRNLISRTLGSSCSAVGLRETSKRSVVYFMPHCHECNIQQPCVLAVTRRQSKHWMRVTRINISFHACFLLVDRS